jgi:putative addiction module killer protein
MSIIKVTIYSTQSNKEPYSDWEHKLDRVTKAIIINRLDRIKWGNFGDAKAIKDGEGIWELRIDFGPGYRIYFGRINNEIVVLLAGGNKSSQDRDIAKAKRYWTEHKELYEKNYKKKNI